MRCELRSVLAEQALEEFRVSPVDAEGRKIQVPKHG